MEFGGHLGDGSTLTGPLTGTLTGGGATMTIDFPPDIGVVNETHACFEK
jgi:hypothetical protein